MLAKRLELIGARVLALSMCIALCAGLTPAAALAAAVPADPNPPEFISGSVDKAQAGAGNAVTISYVIDDAQGVASVAPCVSRTDPASEVPNQDSLPFFGTSADSAGSFTFDIKQSTPAGKRWIVALDVTDKAGYRTIIHDETYAKNKALENVATADLSQMSFEVVGTQENDPNPPAYVSGSVDKARATAGETVTVGYDIEDAQGVESVALAISEVDPNQETPYGGGLAFTAASNVDGDVLKSFPIRVRPSDAPGRKWVVAIDVTDAQGYSTIIYDATYAARKRLENAATADLSALTWEVYGTQENDPNPPKLLACSIDKPVAIAGDVVRISYSIDEPEGVASVAVCVSAKDPEDEAPDGSALPSQALSGDTSSTFPINIAPSTPLGRYWVVSLRIADDAGYDSVIYDETYAKSKGMSDVATADLSALSWEVADADRVPAYKAIEGEGSLFAPGSGAGLTLRFDGAAEDLACIEVDGAPIPEGASAVRSGSTVVELAPAYLETLIPGRHAITAFYKDGGRAQATFNVAEATEDPKDPASEPQKPASGAQDGAADAPSASHDGDSSVQDNPAAKPVQESSLAKTADNAAPPFALAALAASLAVAIAAFSARRLRE